MLSFRNKSQWFNNVIMTMHELSMFNLQWCNILCWAHGIVWKLEWSDLERSDQWDSFWHFEFSFWQIGHIYVIDYIEKELKDSNIHNGPTNIPEDPELLNSEPRSTWTVLHNNCSNSLPSLLPLLPQKVILRVLHILILKY